MQVSVVLCTHTTDRYDDFTEAAESVLSQTYADRELVLVSDGSRPAYGQMRRDYGGRDDVTIHCNDRNVGLLESRNTGAELADGDVVAFIDDDAVAAADWLERLVEGYEAHDAIAVGGRMVPDWVAGEPDFLPAEYYFLIGVTHRGFADGPGEVRNTFGSNISFRREVFLDLDGFDTNIGGRKGDKHLQGGETELCARMRERYGRGVWYDPEARVAHKVFDYRTDPVWLLKRSFWQGYSKRGMEVLVPESIGEEGEFVGQLLTESLPDRLSGLVSEPSKAAATQLGMLLLLTGAAGAGYAYGTTRWR